MQPFTEQGVVEDTYMGGIGNIADDHGRIKE
jgi:hypothetical protein